MMLEFRNIRVERTAIRNLVSGVEAAGVTESGIAEDNWIKYRIEATTKTKQINKIRRMYCKDCPLRKSGECTTLKSEKRSLGTMAMALVGKTRLKAEIRDYWERDFEEIRAAANCLEEFEGNFKIGREEVNFRVSNKAK